jgi:hypothetical protein
MTLVYPILTSSFASTIKVIASPFMIEKFSWCNHERINPHLSCPCSCGNQHLRYICIIPSPVCALIHTAPRQYSVDFELLAQSTNHSTYIHRALMPSWCPAPFVSFQMELLQLFHRTQSNVANCPAKVPQCVEGLMLAKLVCWYGIQTKCVIHSH